MECVPTLKAVLLMDAMLDATPLGLRVPVPRTFVPSMNVTVPIGVPDAGGVALTVAVRITVWPDTVGFGVELRTTVDAARTFCIKAEDTMVLKFVSPLYVAVIVCVP
jgi:hypothetical protein